MSSCASRSGSLVVIPSMTLTSASDTNAISVAGVRILMTRSAIVLGLDEELFEQAAHVDGDLLAVAEHEPKFIVGTIESAIDQADSLLALRALFAACALLALRPALARHGQGLPAVAGTRARIVALGDE